MQDCNSSANKSSRGVRPSGGSSRETPSASGFPGIGPRRVRVVLGAYLGILGVVLGSAGLAENHRMEAAASGSGAWDAIDGKRIWEENGCVVCHSVYGLGGHLGPDLTNVMERYDPRYIRHVMRNGMGKMPGYSLDKDEVEALVQYLGYLNRLGTYPLQSPWHESFGSNH